MSKVVSGLVGAAALVATLGAAQFAVGHDLSGTRAQLAAAAQSDHVNRTSKSDRLAAAPGVGSVTVAQSGAMEGTSLLVRMPRQSLLRDAKAGEKFSTRPVACEAPASVLTEVAKRLESGRCLT